MQPLSQLAFMALLTLRLPLPAASHSTLVPGQTLPGFYDSLKQLMKDHHILHHATFQD